MLIPHPSSRGPVALLIAAMLCLAMGCSGSGSFPSTTPNVSVSLSVPSVTVAQTGTEVIVPINIVSPSETALVVVSGLPSGVKQGYSASDTNPSGVLTFKGDASAPVGTYMPSIQVSSAGGMASTQFKLVVVVK